MGFLRPDPCRSFRSDPVRDDESRSELMQRHDLMLRDMHDPNPVGGRDPTRMMETDPDEDDDQNPRCKGSPIWEVRAQDLVGNQ